MSTAWFRASRHRNIVAARRRRDELVRKGGFRAREVRVQRIEGTHPWTHAVMVLREVTRLAPSSTEQPRIYRAC